MRHLIFILSMVVAVVGCAPKEPIVLREVHILQLTPDSNGNLILKADAIFFNPNPGSMKLREINLEILLDGKQAARIEQKMNSSIKGNAAFTIPLEVQLQLKEMGLVDALLSIFGGKKHEVQFAGNLKVRVAGFPVKIPVNYKDEIKF